MPSKCLVIVESPTKAKTIKKFLPSHFIVEASMGHVRDLPQSAAQIPAKYKKEPWAKIGVNIEEDFEPLYVIPKGKSKIISELKKKLKDVDELYLATDEDREGESISWHLHQLLKPKVPVKRMVFHEITKTAIQTALEEWREIDQRLVQAQEARRILDRLVGYTLSPLIWKKIAYGLSAGRVQSVGLRLIVNRELERYRFKKSDYWDTIAKIEKQGKTFESKLYEVAGKRVATSKDFDETTGALKKNKETTTVVLKEEDCKKIIDKLSRQDWLVKSVDEKPFTTQPAAPFITSTLQQESNRKLGLSARDTMRVAQGLYERGLITYMRTDSPNLSKQAIKAARSCVEDLYGKNYLSEVPRQYKSKSKGAQEAHEAIRPAGSDFVSPQGTGLQGKELALYDLVWKRTVATQMAPAKKRSMSVKIESDDCVFSASGMKIDFPGFLRAYVEGSDSPEAVLNNQEVLLPEMKVGDKLTVAQHQAKPHETKPPARFTEASIVQRLEKEGIGRPSTYASIISTIQDRGYVNKIGNALVSTFTGIAVSQLLETHFEDMVSYDFTSEMEKKLDEIATGEIESIPYLKKFYLGDEGLLSQVEKKEKKIDPDTSRSIQYISIPGVSIKVGRFGPYVVTSHEGEQINASIPEDVAPSELTEKMVLDIVDASKKGPQSLGQHPEHNQSIYCLLGRYGPYVQLGEVTEEVPKPRRASVPKEIDYRQITLEQAVKLLSLPRDLGNHPETGKPIQANNGRFGPYVVHNGDYRSLKEDDVYTIPLERALEILAEEKKGRRGSKLVREVGLHPEHEKLIYIYEGKYGKYMKFRSKNISLPEGVDADKLTLEQAIPLVDAVVKTKGKAKSKTVKKAKTKKS